MQKLRYTLPPPNLLITFEAAGRHSNFTRAAKELNVSRVAVSQQVHALERFLGIALFQRLQRSVQLTPAGQRYHLAIGEALEKALRATVEISKHAETNIVNISATPGFTTYWLLPKIGEFRSIHPDVELRFIVSDTHLSLADENIDIAIRYGDPPFDDADSTFLVRQAISPTCSGNYSGNIGRTMKPRDLLQHPLIYLEGAFDTQTHWSTWFQLQGIDLERPRPGITVNSYTNLVQAALDGQGFALIGPPLIEQFLANGGLIQPVQALPLQRYAFHLLTPRRSIQSSASRAVCDWIKSYFPPSDAENQSSDRQMNMRK